MKVRFLMITFVLLFACGKKEEKLTEKRKNSKNSNYSGGFSKSARFCRSYW
jgi:hypothetical protein